MDWADRQAAEIIKTAFGASDARYQIAAVLRAIKIEGATVGLRQAQQIMNDGLAGRPASVPETVARIQNACRQI